jgi:hypothetical protein
MRLICARFSAGRYEYIPKPPMSPDGAVASPAVWTRKAARC